MTTPEIRYEARDVRATITIDRPAKRNALTAAMVQAILDGVGRAEADDAVKVVVLRGEGPAFCAGYDIEDPADFRGGDAEPLRARIDSVAAKAEWMRRLFHAAKPVIVQAHGACVGIGTYLVLVADFAVASSDAALGLPEERFGSAGATWAYPFLVLTCGLKRANEVVMTGRRFRADEARELGLVNRVVARDELDAEVDDLARAIASLPREGLAVHRAVRDLVTASLGYGSTFAFHAAVHPHTERLARGDDEFDMIRAVGEHGLRAALAQHDEAFGGRWWGW